MIHVCTYTQRGCWSSCPCHAYGRSTVLGENFHLCNLPACMWWTLSGLGTCGRAVWCVCFEHAKQSSCLRVGGANIQGRKTSSDIFSVSHQFGNLQIGLVPELSSTCSGWNENNSLEPWTLEARFRTPIRSLAQNHSWWSQAWSDGRCSSAQLFWLIE